MVPELLALKIFLGGYSSRPPNSMHHCMCFPFFQHCAIQVGPWLVGLLHWLCHNKHGNILKWLQLKHVNVGQKWSLKQLVTYTGCTELIHLHSERMHHHGPCNSNRLQNFTACQEGLKAKSEAWKAAFPVCFIR